MENELYLSGDILDDDCGVFCEEMGTDCIYPKKLYNFFKDTTGDVVLHVNTYGGQVVAALSMVQIIKEVQSSGRKVTAKVSGIAASSGSILIMACDTVVVPEAAYVMIHQPRITAHGTVDDLEKAAQSLRETEDMMVGLYLAKGTDALTEETLRGFLREEKWFTGTTIREFFNVVQEVPTEEEGTAGLDYTPATLITPTTAYSNIPTSLVAKLGEPKDKKEDEGADETPVMKLKREVNSLVSRVKTAVADKDLPQAKKLRDLLNSKKEELKIEIARENNLLELENIAKEVEEIEKELMDDAEK